MKKFTLFCIIALLAVSIVSCGKYEEGPAISLRTKKQRLTGNWKLESYVQNGVDITATVQSSYGADAEWQIKKDGTYHISGNANDDGEWLFYEDKTLLDFSNGDRYQIMRLTNNELWLKYPSRPDTDLIKYKK